jgi:XTP/dITP diphosphohydrolase
MRIVIATTNPGKLKEFKELATGVGEIEFVLAPPGFSVDETGSTFEENAILKARAAAEQTGLISMSDDSGMEVDALGGRPGIYSARYCEGTDADRRKKLLKELDGVPVDKRGAAFVCAMAVCLPTGEVIFTTTIRWRGQVSLNERGENGFGFDPIFFLADLNSTAAEMSPQEKHRISHRGQAFQQVLAFLQTEILKTV